MLQSQSQKGRKSLGLPFIFSLIFCCTLFSAVHAGAQTWQYVYGGQNQERGYSRVTPVKFSCQLTYDPADPNKIPYDGYIAVGTSYSWDANGDVYVVRIKNDGTTAWEYQYDILDNSSADVGRSIVELSDGTGFIVTGWTTTPQGDKDVVVLYIDCQGAIVWSKTVGDPNYDELGYDIIETETGDPYASPPDYPMDVVIAGSSKNRIGSPLHDDGYLIRMTRTGNVLWAQTYDELQHDQAFYGLTELKSSLVNQPIRGDIVAVGRHYDYIGQTWQGYAVRVDGATGLASAALNPKRGSAHYGGCRLTCSTDEFYSVTELGNPAENDGAGPYIGDQDVVIAGYSASPGNKEIYMVKLNGGDLCDVEADNLIGDGSGFQLKFDDVARMVYELPIGYTGYDVQQYDLLVTGYTAGRGTNQIERDVILQTVSPTNLALLPAISKQYGVAGDGYNEEGWSLFQVETNGYKTNGFILCGETDSDPGQQMDPRDMYVIKTDPAGNSGTLDCERAYDPTEQPYGAPVVCMDPTVIARGFAADRNTIPYDLSTAEIACTQDAEKPPVPGIGDNSRSANETPIATAVVPNVINGGNVLRLQLKSNEHVSLTLTLTNVLGEVVREEEMQMQAGSTEMTMKTDDLPKGAYFIAVRKGGQSWTQRVVIQ